MNLDYFPVEFSEVNEKSCKSRCNPRYVAVVIQRRRHFPCERRYCIIRRVHHDCECLGTNTGFDCAVVRTFYLFREFLSGRLNRVHPAPAFGLTAARARRGLRLARRHLDSGCGACAELHDNVVL